MQTIIATLGLTGKDATPFLEKIRPNYSKADYSNMIGCLDAMFFTGVEDTRIPIFRFRLLQVILQDVLLQTMFFWQQLSF